jgi:HAD superfamily hydrolase (TIGR01509 family)
VIAVGFDVDHTLAIDNKLERIAFLHLLSRIDASGGRAIGTLDQETSAIDALLRQQRSGDFTIDEAVRRFARERGIRDAERFVGEFRKIALELVDQVVVALPGVRRLLEDLRKRSIATAVLSNGWNPLQQRKAERAGFAGSVLASAEIGASKPHAEAFAALLDHFALPAHSVWYVGDNPRDDIAAAKEAGLRAIWYNAEVRSYPEELTPPDAVVTDICEVAAIVTGAAVTR